MSRNHSSTGFSKVQLVIWLVIIGLLALFALPKVMQYFERAHEASFDKVAAKMTTSLDEFRDQYLKDGHGASVFEGFTMQPGTGFPIAYNTDDCIKIADKIGKIAKPSAFYHQVGESKAAFDVQYHEFRAGNANALKGDYAVVFEGGACHFYCLKHHGLDKFLSYDSIHATPVTIVPFGNAVPAVNTHEAAPAQPTAPEATAVPAAAPAEGEVTAPVADDHAATQEQPAVH